jgi:predicted ATPase
MESHLRIKDFGPIKGAQLTLKNVNVFIGAQATGKSALAKLYTILKAPRKFLGNSNDENNVFNESTAFERFHGALEEYNITTFLNADTEIEFESELHHLSISNQRLIYTPKLAVKIENLKKLSLNYNTNIEIIKKDLVELGNKFILFSLETAKILNTLKYAQKPLMLPEVLDDLNEVNLQQVLHVIQDTESELSSNTALYIPSERNFINIIRKTSFNLILNNVPIPKHILSFGAELEKLSSKEFSLDFIQKNLSYKNIDGDERIYLEGGKSIRLSESASGIQSVVPILESIYAKKQATGHQSFVIEEPELNLFPSAQYALIKLLESDRIDPSYEDFGTMHTYTTHSPYILSALNNLLYARKVLYGLIAKARSKTPEGDLEQFLKISTRTVREIINADIDPKSFTAYQIENGHVRSIFNQESGLIEDNFIDEASDRITEDFDALMDLLG